jgi:hypothetical protein
MIVLSLKRVVTCYLITCCYLVVCYLAVYNQNYKRRFGAIIVSMPTYEPIPSAPRGFDNLFLLKGTTI